MKKTIFIIITNLLIILANCICLFATNPPETFYPADIEVGYIGISDDMPTDSPTDNVFMVSLNQQPCDTDEIWLTYELYGISDHTGISRSINDQLAVGGQLVKQKKDWSSQTEQLNPAWLKQGENAIRFTLPDKVNYHYQIKNLGIKIKKAGNNQRAIVINQSISRKSADNWAYVKGFVKGTGSDEAKLYANDIPLLILATEFESLKYNKEESENWTVSLKAIFTDGEVIEEDIHFTNNNEANLINELPIPAADFITNEYKPTLPFTACLQAAQISIEPEALTQQTDISITALRTVDIPALDIGMVNVTKDSEAYRFLPHGTIFSKAASIKLAYDESKIPDGYTAKDIKTYFFDEASKHWVALPLDSVQMNKKTIISSTTHFTDMINGIIKAPESPETAGYTPTSIKDIKAADPSAAVNTIEPPGANNTGTANMGYPIALPAGRQGMQPQLGIQYNSGGGNDWIGLGWNLTIPSVSIDTRWGVPRYDTALETETYSLNGAQLAPVAHRNEWQPRTSEKQFHPRVEGSFQKIIRRGDNPTNYWWEVTDKSGTVYSYGGVGDNIVESSVLKDDIGNIAHWALVEVRDLNKNFVRYHCTKVEDFGVEGGTVPGHNIYIDRITYTGHETEEGKYEVLFTRDRELGEMKRTDINISARYGFKKVTADLLRKIEVNFKGEPIRSYELNYTDGAFYKTLLETITEFDAAGNPFTKHEFGYFDDVKAANGYEPFDTLENWTPQKDDVKGKFVNPLDLFNDEASVLSGTKSNNFGSGLAVTFGKFDTVLYCKSNSIGGDFSFSESSSEGILSLIDIDGDGLSDKVFMNEEGFSYRPNVSGPGGETSFGDNIPITSINKFYEDKSSTTNTGFQVNAGCDDFSAFIGVSISNTKSQTTVYFTDVNGDQLIDVAVGGQVFFNHIDDNGHPVFTPSSADTPSPIFQSGAIDESIFTIDSMEIENAIDQNPLHDVVRVWEAPFSGMIAIEAPARLIQPAEPSGTADGVKLSIQKNSEELLLWNTTIEPNNFEFVSPDNLSDIAVEKGDRIYFRVQSIYDGTDDQVYWNPLISYSEERDDLVDANNLPIYQFDAQNDFLISSAQSITMPIDGTIIIKGIFEKPITSDNLVAQITKDADGSVVWIKNCKWDKAETEDVDITLAVTAGDSYSFTVNAETNIDWADIKWKPEIFYTESADPNYKTDNLFNSNNEPILKFHPSINYSLFAETIQKTNFYQALANETVEITPSIILQGMPSGKLIFSIKKVNELVIGNQPLTVNEGEVTGITPTTINLEEGEKIFLDFHTTDKALAESILQSIAFVTVNGIDQQISTGLFTVNDEMIFGPQNRNWGQFVYNGNRERANEIIDEAELKLDDAFMDGEPIDLETENLDSLEAMAYNPSGSIFIMMIPDNEKQRWLGYDNLTYIEADMMSSSRMGEDDLSVLSPIPEITGTAGGTGATAINKITKSTSTSISLGAGVPIGESFDTNGSYSRTDGSTSVCSDFIDMNGDRYPDIVTETHIQYTNATGGLSGTAISHNFGVNNLSNNVSDGVTLGGSYATAESQGTIYNVNNRKLIVGKGAGGGLSGNFAKGKNDIDFSWRDINGDGLPDRIYEGGQVALNLGYKFAPLETWGYDAIQEGKSTSYGTGLGINIGSNSIAAGISLSRSESEGQKSFQDINGDGLVDELILDNPIKVKLNTGNGFGPTLLWKDANALSKSSSTSESANIAFTVCIPIPPPPAVPVTKLCFNPSSNNGQSVSRELTQIRDIDGDGFPDFLKSTKDNDLTVRRSTIGRTNLLKTVKRPLGASFAVDYKRVGNTYEQPGDVWTLAKVELHDGFNGDGADRMVNTFEYEGGYYDRHERDFYGFKKVKSNQHDTEKSDSIYRTVVQEFINSNYYQNGLLRRNFLQDADGNLYTEDLTSYELLDVTTGLILPDSIKFSDDACAFPAAVLNVKRFYEGEAQFQKGTNMTYEYDNLGNVIAFKDAGDSGPQDDIFSTISYHNYGDSYIKNAPSSITVYGTDNTIYRKRKADIDSLTGNVTNMRSYLENGDSVNYDMDYDQYGNIKKMERPWNALGERMTYKYTYDTEVQTYNTSVSDSYGYSSSATYNYHFGQMLTSTDLNNNPMRYEIDSVGRITTITGPFELAADTIPYTIAFEYYPNDTMPYAKTKHYDPSHPDNDLETYTFIDGLKRPLQVKKDGALYTGTLEDEEKMIVSGRVNFDAFGRTTLSYYPVIEDMGRQGLFNYNYDNIKATSTEYDVLDRQTATYLPDLAVTTFEYGFGADRDGKTQFSTKVTDANGVWKESFTNVRGLNKATHELHRQGTNIWTSFDYNPINELLKVTDDQKNEIVSSYDWLGRRTKVKHPDAGTTTFKYDLASNLTKKITAKLKEQEEAIRYKYEFERLTNINYPFNTYNDVTYVYGDSVADKNRIGRLVRQKDATGEQKFSYNVLGAITKNVRTIHVPDCESLEFTTKFTYDTWNRLTEMVYPDKEQVTYTYNLGGLLYSMNGFKKKTDYPYVEQLGYDKFEQRVYLHYGNETSTHYTYEPERRRLKTMKAETKFNRKFIDYVYEYDKVSNVKGMQNLAGVEKDSHLLGGQTNYTYEYDDLYRLIEANGYHKGSKGEDKYKLEMEYNSVHSIMAKEQLHERKINTASVFVKKKKTSHSFEYKYDKVKQPHAPIHVGEKSYLYDANGNQTGWDHDKKNDYRRILWDEENRMAAINDNGAVFKYLYDAGGERVLKNTGHSQAVSIDGATHGGLDPDHWAEHWNNGQAWYDHWHTTHSDHTHHSGNYNDTYGYDDHCYEHGHEHVHHNCLNHISIYVSPFVVVRNKEVSKHFYIEGQRVVTKMADPYDQLFQNEGGPLDEIHNEIHNIKPMIESNIYFYHPDHLGNTGYVSQVLGEVNQHVEYFAFGETFLEEHNNNTDQTPYLFNAKEQDEETGLYYYGARYYDPVVSNWLSVDPPMMDGRYLNKKINGGVYNSNNLSIYSYGYQNPIKYIDPNGEKITVRRGLFNFIRKIFGQKPLVRIKVTGKLLDHSSNRIDNGDLKDISKRISSSIEDTYQGEGNTIKWKASAKVQVARRGEKSITKNDHAYRIYDQGKLPDSKNPGEVFGGIGHAPDGQNVVEISNWHFDIPKGMKATLEITSAHETGHSGGLKHRDDDIFNVMHEKAVGNKINESQILKMEELYKNKKLNKGIQLIDKNYNAKLLKQ